MWGELPSLNTYTRPWSSLLSFAMDSIFSLAVSLWIGLYIVILIAG
jgi:hypothetical protein